MNEYCKYDGAKNTRIKKSSAGCSGLGTVGLCLTIGTFALGPFDLYRVVYNNIIGNMPLLKNQIVSYVRDNIKRESNYTLQGAELEKKTAEVLCTNVGLDGKINSENVSTETMFDAAEDHAASKWERWVALHLNDQ